MIAANLKRWIFFYSLKQHITTFDDLDNKLSQSEKKSHRVRDFIKKS